MKYSLLLIAFLNTDSVVSILKVKFRENFSPTYLVKNFTY